MIRLQDDRVDLLLVDQGFLLLDVRPVQRLSVETLGQFVAERKALLDRFYGSHSLTARRTLDVVYVCGEAENSVVRKQILDLGLSVQSLSHEVEANGWRFAADANSVLCTAAIGALCGHLPDTQSTIRPDLLSVLSDTETESLKNRIVQTLWPLVAAALLCMMFYTMSNAERNVAKNFDSAVATYEQTQVEIEDLEYRIDNLSEESDHLARIAEQTVEASWDELVRLVAACMPLDSSLIGWTVNNDRTLQLRGRCSKEESAYQFVEYVSRLPQIKRAALAGTKTATGVDLDGVEFDVVVELNSGASPRLLAEAESQSETLQR